MASITCPQIMIPLLLLASIYASAHLVPAHSVLEACCNQKGKNKIIEFYIHDTFTGPNSTLLYVAGPGSLANLSFGTVGVVDDPITEGELTTSTALGRMRGSFTIVSLNGNGLTFLFSLSVVWNGQKYNGTISLFGSRDETTSIRDLPIVGGTGDFVRASGVASATPISPIGSPIGTIHYLFNITMPS